MQSTETDSRKKIENVSRPKISKEFKLLNKTFHKERNQ